jgi:hypothetical protein
VVGLLPLRSADIARYRLPDHRITPGPHISFADSFFPIFPYLSLHGVSAGISKGRMGNPMGKIP